MTTKELIRAELKRLEEMDYPVDTYEQSVGFYNALDRIKSFLDTLEEPVSEDLEEVAEEYADYNSRRWQEDGDIYYDHSKIKDAFKAGAEWQSKKEQDIIETAEDHAFFAGANWQKEQMMKGAVEGEVVKDISNKLAVTAKNINLEGFKFGDKVRIIIVKEEEE